MSKDVLKHGEEIRSQVLELAEDYAEAGERAGLPAFGGVLNEELASLRANRFTVLVCGELKRGKSSFINGLLGDDVLPTGIEVTTSQAFRIRNAESEAYRLRFTDDTARSLTREELRSFGDQKAVDAHGGVLELDGKRLSCIEVDYPARFLPANLELIDTPGMGALYAHHAEITEAFVYLADGVIFVLDTSREIGEQELLFVDNILKRTPYVFFIQTKIDEVDNWESILQENERRLRERVGTRCALAPRVWPISNKSLREAASADNERSAERKLRISRYEQLQERLDVFLYFVAGWAKSATTTLHLSSHARAMRGTLDGRMKMLETEDKEKLEELERTLREKQKKLEAEWGEHGQKTTETLKRVKKQLQAVHQEFWQMFEMNGNLYQSVEATVSETKKMKQLQQLSQELPEIVSEAIMSEARRLIDWLESEQNKTYANLVASMDLMQPYPSGIADKFEEALLKGLNIGSGIPLPRQTIVDHIRKTLNGIIRTTLTPVISLREFLSKIILPKSGQLHRAREQVMSEVVKILRQIQSNLKKIDVASEQYDPAVSVVFQEQQRAWEDLIAQIRKEKSAALNTELERVKKAIAAEKEERKARLESVKADLTTFGDLGLRLTKAMQAIQGAKRELSSISDASVAQET